MIAAFHRIQAPVSALDLLVAGEARLGLGRNGVDVVGRGEEREPDMLLRGRGRAVAASR
jgi:hypothetical protein